MSTEQDGEPTATIQALRASTADLVRALDRTGWSDDDARSPSRCEGWTRGHLLTHIARNADGITATLSGALRGEVVERYAADGGRERDIEAGAGRPFTELRADVADTAERLDRVFAAVTEADAWDAPTAEGRAARDWTSRRLCEVEVHHVDLDAGYGPDRWPPLLVRYLLEDVAAALGDRLPGAVRVVLTTDGAVCADLAGREWTVGTGDAVEVRGPDWAVAAWVCGRGDLAADHLSANPDLRRWR